MKDTQTKKQKREELFLDIYNAAVEAGNKTAAAAVPTPMVVSQHESPLDDNSRVTKQWYVAEGACGFGWAIIRPGTHSFARWLKKTGRASRNYYGGMCVWSPLRTQSVTRNEAWAEGFAKVLREVMNIHAYAQSRLD